MTVLALAGLALTGMSASGATAAPGRLLAGDAVSRMVSDGTRYAAFEPRVGVLRVLDAFDGSEGTTRDLALPAGCDTRFDVGGPVAVGGGVALLQCGQSGYWPSAQVHEDGPASEGTGRLHRLDGLPAEQRSAHQARRDWGEPVVRQRPPGTAALRRPLPGVPGDLHGGPAGSITAIRLTGTTLNWRHDGAPRSATLTRPAR